MPAKGKSKVTDAQRKTIAAGKAAGVPHREIAAMAGLAKPTVDRQVSDPRTLSLILEWKEEDKDQLRRIWRLAMKRIERDVVKPDHKISATARAQFFRVLTLGDPPLLRISPPDSANGDFTLEELLVTYRRISFSG